MAGLAYFEAMMPVLQKAIATQTENVRILARWMADAIKNDHLIYVFGAGHAGMIAEEMCYRAGSLVPTNAILPPGLTVNTRPLPMETELERLPGMAAVLLKASRIRQGDLLIVHSNSGRNTVAIELAEMAKKDGIQVVALTSVSHSRSVPSRHPGGVKLMDVADLVIDNCGIPGDAVVAFEGLDQRSGATSTVVGAALMNAAICEVVQILLDEQVSPPVFQSANLDGSDQHNQDLMDRYAGRLLYL
jgi:uncharacterized phosphosugar-binding protein